MILSMTGFGESRAEQDGVSFHVEIRTLNNRYFKATIKVPEVFQRFETVIDRQLRSRMGRGSVSYNLRLKDENPSAAYEINTALLAEYVRKLKQVADGDTSTRIDLARLVEVPGVFLPPSIDEAVLQEQFRVIQKLTEQAMDQLIEMRKVEGKGLQKDIVLQCETIRSRLAAIVQLAPGVVEEYHKTLQNRVQQLLRGTDGTNYELFQESIGREVAIFAERCDVNEEVSRIASHLEQFEHLCGMPEPTGRKLDFLSQELLREANTIGSKSNSSEIAMHIVEIKAAIDRIKEQVQNVE